MKGKGVRRCAAAMLIAAVALISPGLNAVGAIPDSLVLRVGGDREIQGTLPLCAAVMAGSEVVAADRTENAALRLTAGAESGNAEVELRLLGLIPVKTVRVTVQPELRLIPGGKSLGVAVRAQGGVVVGASNLGKRVSPASAAGIRAGDVIVSVNGNEVTDSKMLSEAMAAGEEARLRVQRGDDALDISVTPEKDPRDGNYRLGVWVRENTAGVGTLTYYDPATGRYGALGHAITDVDTGSLFPVKEGAVYENSVESVTRGKEGAPGELTGGFMNNEIQLGEIHRNTDCGVFGLGESGLGEGGLYPDGLPVASRDEIHAGKAEILSCVDGKEVRAYECEIERVNASPERHTRTMVIHVTDPELIEKTGGIVQGMSGSPVIQDGKLIGAVTHVLIDDPTRGYGIAIESMLEAADAA